MDDVTRWEACSEATFVPGDPSVYNPALKHTREQLWAVKYNTQLMRHVRAHEKNISCVKGSLFVLMLPEGALVAEDMGPDCTWATWLCCGVTRSQAMFLRAVCMPDGRLNVDQNETEFTLSITLIASLCSRVEGTAGRPTGKHLTVYYTHAPAIVHEQANSNLATRFVIQEGMPSIACVLRARYQRSGPSDPSIRALTDGQSDSEEEAQAAGCTLGMNDESLMRMLHGWDDFSDAEADVDDDVSESAPCDNTASDLAELEELNVKMAAGAANRQSDEDTKRIREAVARQATTNTTISTLSPVEAETEAFLQELLLPKHVADDDNNIFEDSQQRGNCEATESAAPCASACLNPSDCDRFCKLWQASVLESCKALEHRSFTATRPLGDNSALDGIHAEG